MIAPGRNNDNPYGQNPGNAATRGALLIGGAVLIGVILLAWGFNRDGSSSASDSSGATTTDTTADDATGDDTADSVPTDSIDDSTTSDPTNTAAAVPSTPVVRPPSEVRVAAVNGSGINGLAGKTMEKLAGSGYVSVAENPAPTYEARVASAIFFVAGYDAEAREVATLLGAPQTIVAPTADDPCTFVPADACANVTGFHVIVVLGSDGQAGT